MKEKILKTARKLQKEQLTHREKINKNYRQLLIFRTEINISQLRILYPVKMS